MRDFTYPSIYPVKAAKEPPLPILVRIAPVIASLTAVLVGGAVIVGWVADIPAFTTISPQWESMKVVPALAFILCGASLWLLWAGGFPEKVRRAGQILGGLVALAGLLSLVPHVIGRSPGMDELPGHLEPDSTNGMPAMTAINFCLLGLSLLGLDWKTATGRRPMILAAAVCALLGLLGFAGYLYGVEPHTVPLFSSMAAHSAVLFVVVSIGVICAHTGDGPFLIFTSRGVGGAMARRMLPFAVIVPLMAGWVRLMCEQAGLFSLEFGVALFAISNLIFFSVLIWMTAVWLDRTDASRQAAEEQLAANERRFRGVLDNMIEGCQLHGHDWRYLYVNDTAARHGRFPKEELLGRTVMECYPGIEDTRLFKTMQYCMETRQVQRIEEEYHFPDGTKTWFELSFQPVPEGLFVHSIDITNRKLTEQTMAELNTSLEEKVVQRTAELHAKNQELETFTYSVSHDLKAPLRGIAGYSRLLLEDHAGQLNDEGRRFLNAVRSASGQMAQLIDDLLSYSQLERRTLHPGPVSLRDTVDTLLAASAHEIEQAGIAIKVDLTEIKVRADRDGLQLALRNLIDNALKFTKNRPDPAIEIKAWVEDSSCIIRVQDNGIGFDMKFIDCIFDIFQRLHRAEDYPGTGVGLAIVRKAMQRMGGRAWAESSLGQGASFYLSIPIAT